MSSAHNFLPHRGKKPKEEAQTARPGSASTPKPSCLHVSSKPGAGSAPARFIIILLLLFPHTRTHTRTGRLVEAALVACGEKPLFSFQALKMAAWPEGQ